MEDRPYRRCLPELRWIGSSSWFPDRDGNLSTRDRQTRAIRTGQELSWIAFVEHSFGGAWIGRFPRFRKIPIVSQFRFLYLRKFYFPFPQLCTLEYARAVKGKLAPRSVKWKKDLSLFSLFKSISSYKSCSLCIPFTSLVNIVYLLFKYLFSCCFI